MLDRNNQHLLLEKTDNTNNSFIANINKLAAKLNIIIEAVGTFDNNVIPVLEEVASSRGNIKVVKVDVDKHNELARKYGIMSIPTLVYFKNGKLEKTSLGYVTKDEIEENINNLR